MKMKKALQMGMTAAMLSMGFAAVAAAEEPVEVEYWCLFGGADGETMTKMVDTFNAEYEGKIKVNCITQDWDNYYTKIKTAILGGEAPDLCNSHDEYVNGLIKDNVIIPVDDEAERLGVEFDYDNYIDKINQLKSDDHIYAIPMDCLQLLLSYHKDMIAEAGLADENGNLVLEDGIDGFLAAVDTLNENLDVPGFAINPSGSIPMYLFNSLYYQCGGEGTFVNEEGTEFIADKDTAVKAMDIFQKVGQASLQNVENISDLFIQKKVAMVIEGAWQMNYLYKNTEDYGVQSLPLLGDTYKSAIYSHTFVLPNKPERTDEVTKATLEFVKWFSDHNDMWAEAGSVPAYIPAQDTELMASYPMHDYFKEAVAYATPFTATAPFALKGSAEMNEPLGKLARGEETPEECFDEVLQRLTSSFN